MSFNIRYKTLSQMLELCKEHKAGKLKRKDLEKLLEHDDYKVEFSRYNQQGIPMTNITKDEFIDYFMGIFDIKLEEIENQRLKRHHSSYKNFFENLDFYEDKINDLIKIRKDFYEEGLTYATNGLPNNIDIGKLDIIFTISIGNSCGWFYNDCLHFDVIQLFNILDMNDFKAFIGHEAHHVGFEKFLRRIDINNLNPEEYLYLFLAGEGLAIKYCNNGEGILTKKIYKDLEPNIGLDKYTWQYLNEDFHDIYKNFKDQIERIRTGNIKNIEDLNTVLLGYWWNCHTKEQSKDEEPRLKHSRNYSFGNDIWGLIHDIYGKDKVFEILKDIKIFPQIFNDALIKIGRKDLMI